MAPKKKAAAKKAPKKSTAVKPAKASDKPAVYDLSAGESLPGPYPTKK